jgi:hypothetical protein
MDWRITVSWAAECNISGFQKTHFFGGILYFYQASPRFASLQHMAMLEHWHSTFCRHWRWGPSRAGRAKALYLFDTFGMCDTFTSDGKRMFGWNLTCLFCYGFGGYGSDDERI